MTTFQARIIKPDGSGLEAPAVDFTMTYRSHDGTCTLYVERFTGISMGGSKGLIALQMGGGTKIYPATAATVQSVFDNAPTTPHRCLQPSNPAVDIGTYSSMTATSGRVLIVQFNDQSAAGTQTVAGITINASPYAWYSKIAGLAHNSEKLGNLLPSNFLQWTDMQASSCSPGQYLTYDASGTPKFSCSTPTVSSGVSSVSVTAPVLNTGTAVNPVIELNKATSFVSGYLSSADFSVFAAKLSNFSTMTSTDVNAALQYTPMRGSNNLSEITNVATARANLGIGAIATLGTGVGGDLTGNLPNPTVAEVGGQTASEVATAVSDTQAATAVHSTSTLIKRDASGNFQAGRAGLGSIELFDNTRTNKITLKAPASGITDYVLTLPPTVGGNGQVLTTNASGDLSWSTPNAAGVSSVSVTAPVVNSGTATNPIIGLNKSTASVDGYLSSTDFTAFAAKLSSFSTMTSADVVGALTYTPLNPITNSVTNTMISSVDWTKVQNRPNTLAGYGIGDAVGTATAFSGDVTGTYNNTSVTKIRGVLVDTTASAPASGDVLRFDGTKYIAAAIPSAPVQSVAGRTGAVTLTSADITGLGTAAMLNIGTTTGTVAAGDDARFTDARTPSGAASGDLSGTYPNPSVAKIQGRNVTLNSITSGDILQYNGTDFVNRNIPTCGANEYLTFNGSVYSCVTDSGSAGTVASVSVTAPVVNSGTATNPIIGLNKSTASVDGYLSSTDFTAFAAKLSNFSTMTSADVVGALTYTPLNPIANSVTNTMISSVDWTKVQNRPNTLAGYGIGDAVGTATAFSGDVTGTYNNTSVTKIRGVLVDATASAPASGDVLRFDGTKYIAAAIPSGGSSQWTTTGNNIYYNTGKVGVGTTTPNANIHTKATVAKTGKIKTSGTTVTGTGTNFMTAFAVGDMIVADGQNKTITAIASNTSMTVNTAWTTNLTVDKDYYRVDAVFESGAVGIGTVAPADFLDLSLDSPDGLDVGLHNYDPNGYSEVHFITDTSALGIGTGGSAGNPNAWIWNYNNTGLQFGTNNVERMYITNSGLIGIGTNSPVTLLDVNGSIRVGNSITCSLSTKGAMRYSDANGFQICVGGIPTWQTISTSSGVASLNGLTSGTQTFATPGTAGTAPAWSSSSSTHTLNIPMANAASVTAGLISKSDYDSFSAKLGTSTAFSGDVTGTASATSVAKLQNSPLALSSLASGDLLKFNGASWVNSKIGAQDLKNNLGTQQFPNACSSNQTMTWSAVTDTFVCTSIAVTTAQVTGLANSASIDTTNASNITSGTLAAARLPASVTDALWSVTASGDVYRASGNVGIGTSSTPNEKLEINGNVRVGSQTTRTTASERGQLALGSTYVQTTNANVTIDWNHGNIQELNGFVCDGTKTITFANAKDGAAYTLLITGAGAHSGVCLFAGGTFKASGGNVAPTTSRDVLFTFAVINTTIIYNMIDNLQ